MARSDVTDEWPLDFGIGYRGAFTCWAPDRELNPQYDGIPDVDRFGLILLHPDARDPAKSHESGLTFDGPVQQQVSPNTPRWTVHSFEPLHLEPSILCTPDKGGCGAHGWIRDGKWVNA